MVRRSTLGLGRKHEPRMRVIFFRRGFSWIVDSFLDTNCPEYELSDRTHRDGVVKLIRTHSQALAV